MNKELIGRFFRKECSAAEAKKVAAYLKVNPGMLEKYAGMYEWDLPAESNAMPEAFWTEVWQDIQKKNKAKIIALNIKRSIAAACIILLAGFSVYYFMVSSKEKKSLTVVKTNSLQPQYKKVFNSTAKAQVIILEDSSVIKLSPASFVQYANPFTNDKRDIIIEGEAEFHVAKNKSKPFTVYAGNLATTALGTVFRVNKITGKNIVTVQLSEGKVVIHSTIENMQGWKKDIYLLPGEELKFDESSSTLAIKQTDSNNKKIAKRKREKPVSTDSLNKQLSFNNTALPQVMNKLAAYYNVTIKYDTSFIDRMNFTGTVSKKDSVDIILKAIGQMNGFIITGNENEFIITKDDDQ